MYEILKLLEKNALYTHQDIAVMLNISEEEVAAKIAEYEKAGILKGYKAIVDWERTEREYVSATIELRVTPKKDRGFEELAETISQFREVESLYLMSGDHDLSLEVVGKSFRDIASFVAYRLAPLDSVQSTATHFVLRKYKEKGVSFLDTPKDERRMML